MTKATKDSPGWVYGKAIDIEGVLLTTDEYIKKFAKDFNIDYHKYKYDERNLIVIYNCIDSSPSEVRHYNIKVPAFLIKTHYKQLNAHTLAVLERLKEHRLLSEKDGSAIVHRGNYVIPLSAIQAEIDKLKGKK